jgi:hypothetical protein
MIPLCWVNLPFGQNHPTYLKFVVSMYFAITSLKWVFSRLAAAVRQGFCDSLGFQPQDHGPHIIYAKNADNPDIPSKKTQS